MSNSGDMRGAKANAKPPIKVVMDCYDALPKIVREKVASASLDWDTKAIYAHLSCGLATPAKVIETIDQYEREFLQRAR